jgi:hypothetical protein
MRLQNHQLGDIRSCWQQDRKFRVVREIGMGESSAASEQSKLIDHNAQLINQVVRSIAAQGDGNVVEVLVLETTMNRKRRY